MTHEDPRAAEITPHRASEPALVDLVDVLLTDGVVLRADVVITVADVPLIGLDLRAMLSGMETMTEYGRMVEWDEELRARAQQRGIRNEGAEYGVGRIPQPTDPMAEDESERYGVGRIPDPTDPAEPIKDDGSDQFDGVGHTPDPDDQMEKLGDVLDDTDSENNDADKNDKNDNADRNDENDNADRNDEE